MHLRTEIGIVGAGPAGARAAELLAAAGAEVVLFDPRAPWEKPCGGGLTAAAIDNIPALQGVLPHARHIDTVRLEAGDTTLVIPLQRPLHIISRTALGLWQLDRARSAGAVLEPVAVRAIRRAPEAGWELDLGDYGTATVALLVGADGAASRVRQAVAPDLEIELAPTRVAYPPGAGRRASEMGLRFFPDAEGYAWDFPRPDHRSLGVGVAPGTWSRRRMDEEVNRYWDALGRCECVEVLRAGAVIGTAGRRLDWRYALVGQRDYALLGDAAGFADPATGEGIQNAIRSGEFLAEAFLQSGDFGAYTRIARSRLEREFAVARRVRRLLYAGRLASRLIELAERHALAHALLATIVDGGNAHDPALLRRIPAEWMRLRRDRRRPQDFGAERTHPPAELCGTADCEVPDHDCCGGRIETIVTAKPTTGRGHDAGT